MVAELLIRQAHRKTPGGILFFIIVLYGTPLRDNRYVCARTSLMVWVLLSPFSHEYEFHDYRELFGAFLRRTDG